MRQKRRGDKVVRMKRGEMSVREGLYEGYEEEGVCKGKRGEEEEE